MNIFFCIKKISNQSLCFLFFFKLYTSACVSFKEFLEVSTTQQKINKSLFNIFLIEFFCDFQHTSNCYNTIILFCDQQHPSGDSENTGHTDNCYQLYQATQAAERTQNGAAGQA
uniref:Uncharacterized protein n=1 Tax=Maylandia zebra TaxID=106582 RepID=A0A3P9CF40_9CICH